MQLAEAFKATPLASFLIRAAAPACPVDGEARRERAPAAQANSEQDRSDR
jgi:hypothetical protein